MAVDLRTEIGNTPAAIVTRTRPTELIRQVNLDYLSRAYGERGVSLSVALEQDDPSSDYPNEQTDAFQRLMQVGRVRTRSAPQWGVAADEVAAFERMGPSGKILMYEYFARCWRAAATGQNPNTRALYTSQDQPLNTISNPYADRPGARWTSQLEPAIPIAAVVGETTGIDRRTYRAFYLTDNASQSRMVRVAESTEIPRAKLTGGEREIQLYKYGRALEMTYEQMREMRIDVVARNIQRLAVQAEIDKLATIIDVMVNGDGNSGTAATSFNLTTLDSEASVGELTLKAWLAFKKKLSNPYVLNTALMQDDVSLQLELLSTGNANVPLAVLAGANSYGSISRINQTGDAVNYGWTADAPASKILGFDKRVAIERVFQVGANVQEMQRFINNQTELMTMTETEGYAVIDGGAAKLLNLAA